MSWTLAIALPPAVQWEKQYGPGAAGEFGQAVIQTADGGYAVAGVTDFLDLFGDFMLLRLDANGDTLWTRIYVDLAGEQSPRALFQKPDNGFVIGGQHNDFMSGDADYRLIETDAAGNLVGTHTYADPNYDLCADMIPTADGGVMFVGTRDVSGVMQANVQKVDNAWNLEWDSTYAFFPTGSNGAADIRQTGDGGYALAGTFQNVDSTKIFLAKINALGFTQWAVLLDPYGMEWGYCLELAGSGFVVGGMADTGGPDLYDACLIATDGAGTLLWSGTYGGADVDWARDLSATPDGGLVATGYNVEGFDDYTYIFKTDGSGIEYWSVLLGAASSDEGRSVRPTADGGYVATGLRARPDAEDQNIYVVKLIADVPLPVELLAFDARIVGDGIELSFTTAAETNTAYFEILRSAGADFAAIARLEGAGNSTTERHYSFADQRVNPGTTYRYFLADIDADGNRTEHRDRMQTVTFGGTAELPADFALSAFPNPFNPGTTVEFALPEALRATVKVFDPAGRLVRTLADNVFPAGSHRVAFAAAGLPSGIYLVRVEAGEYSKIAKLVLLK
ncbi:T9SS type A sorting domain-containing protein [candidate division KSB1 bacterium]|nr:T9SS type A sorting domain-containing protein [candidate division KSB1 bacterium]